jgi:hypothetical protein
MTNDSVEKGSVGNSKYCLNLFTEVYFSFIYRILNCLSGLSVLSTTLQCLIVTWQMLLRSDFTFSIFSSFSLFSLLESNSVYWPVICANCAFTV